MPITLALTSLSSYLAEQGASGEPGLTDDALRLFEAALGVQLPAQARAMYRCSGGFAANVRTGLPMRLMPPGDVLEVAKILREAASTYAPRGDARYLFTDDNSNWIGLFVEGPLMGKLSILDHDVSSPAPRFRDLASFLEKLVAAGRADVDWPGMQTDYPLTASSEAALIDEARPLAALFRERYLTGDDPAQRNADAVISLHLSDPHQGELVRELLSSPFPYVREVALVVAAAQRRGEWIPDLIAHAQAAQEYEHYTAWFHALKALEAIGATAQVDVLAAAARSGWRSPIRRRSVSKP